MIKNCQRSIDLHHLARVHRARDLQCRLLAAFAQHLLENFVEDNGGNDEALAVFDHIGKAGCLHAAGQILQPRG